MKNKKYVIMCVGYTHSGKTTFAQALVKTHPNIIQIDSDDFAIFAREKFPKIVESDYNKNKAKKNLKMILFDSVYEFALHTGFNIILSNGNVSKNIRSLVSRQAKKQGYQLVTIYFNLPEEVILKRMENTNKSKQVFIQSKSWAEVLERQKTFSEFPPSKKNTIYFEIKNDADYEMIAEELDKLLTG